MLSVSSACTSYSCVVGYLGTVVMPCTAFSIVLHGCYVWLAGALCEGASCIPGVRVLQDRNVRACVP